MQWINASDKLPPRNKQIPMKVKGVSVGGSFLGKDFPDATIENTLLITFSIPGSATVSRNIEKSELQWLDESAYDDFMICAINSYYHQAIRTLEANDLGDLERREWEVIRDQSKEWIRKIMF